MLQVLKSGLIYFALVFSAGFILGTARTLWVVPRIGARAAELAESPIMLLVSVLAARWVAQRLAVPYVWLRRLGMGLSGLALLLVAEFTLVVWLRGVSIRDYLASRDPLSGTVYYLLLVVFALMPLFVARR